MSKIAPVEGFLLPPSPSKTQSKSNMMIQDIQSPVQTDISTEKLKDLITGKRLAEEKFDTIAHVLVEMRTRLAELEVENKRFRSTIVQEGSNSVASNDKEEESGNKKIKATSFREENGEEPVKNPFANIDESFSYGYTLSPSMWDVTLFLGLDFVGQVGSIHGGFLLLINIVAQVDFTYIVLNNFTAPQFTDNVILELRSWRRNIAHNIEFMEEMTGVSLASRVCNNDAGLEMSSSQAGAHDLLSAYISGEGSLMSVLIISMWLLTVFKELSSVVSFFQAVYEIPKAEHTVFNKEGNAVLRLSHRRHAAVMAITVLRLLVVVSLGYAGAAWLANTVSLFDLILNAVALEFVLTVDEIIFEALASHRLKSLVDNFADSPLPITKPAEWKGVDSKSFSMFSLLTLCIFLIWGFWVLPFEYRLKLADDALCAGELDFVYTVGGSGMPAWSESPVYRDPFGKRGNAASSGTGKWGMSNTIHKQDLKTMNFVMATVDTLVDGFGKPMEVNTTCGDPVYFKLVNQTIDDLPVCFDTEDACVISFCESQYFIGLVDLDGNQVYEFEKRDRQCCLADQIHIPSIDGGRLSLSSISVETVSSATELLNAGCVDQFGFVDPFEEDQSDSFVSFYNVIGGAFSDALGGTCGGLCPAHKPYCDAETSECRNITCADVSEICLEDTLAGLRARQFCPITCGCANPSESLILHNPDFGCPETCRNYDAYEEAVDDLECVDQRNTSALMIEYVEEVNRISLSWPGFWRDEWRNSVGAYLENFGCDSIIDLQGSASTPQDLCVFGGTMWPIKPIAYLCPDSCDCATNMMWGCPSSCELNATASS